MNTNLVTADFSPLRGHAQPGSVIIAIGGGKGGVGKSFVSSSLAIFLAQLGYKTLAIDLDLGGANLHTSMGLPTSNCSINEFIHNPNMDFQAISQPTHWPNLRLVSGSSASLEASDIDETQKSRIMSAIYKNQADFTILDLSAGTHQTTLDFFLMAQVKVTVFTPDPTSIENAYRFLKASFLRKLKRYEHQLHLRELIADLLSARNSRNVSSPAELLRLLAEQEPAAAHRLKELLTGMNYEIVLNQARTRQELDMGYSLQSVCNKYFGFPCEFLGGLEYDNAVWQSLRQRHHLLMANRQTHLYAQLMCMARKISKTQQLKAVV